MGTVENLYVEEDSRDMRFVDVVTNGFLGLGRKHHLVPVEAVSEQDPGWITLGVAQETVERAPIFPNPRFGANEDYQVRSPNFLEPRTREVRRIYLLRRWANSVGLVGSCAAHDPTQEVPRCPGCPRSLPPR
jgi:hypothetical protein